MQVREDLRRYLVLVKIVCFYFLTQLVKLW